MTNGDADTPWHPQFLNPVTFESQRLTNDSPMVYPSHALRHGDVRFGEPRDTALRFTSRFLLVHSVVYPGMSCLERGGRFQHKRQKTTLCSVSAISVRSFSLGRSLWHVRFGHRLSGLKLEEHRSEIVI